MTSPDTLSEARRQLLERLRRGELQAPNGAPEPLIPRTPDTQAPLAPELEQLWLHEQLAGGAPIYNESVTIHKRGPLDAAVLERCFNEIARRHEIWRSAFPSNGGKVVQRIDSNVRVPLPLVDLSHLPVEEREAEAVRIATEDASRPFDLNVAPLFRVRLVRWAEDYHRVYLTLHRLVFDCESIYHVLIRELGALYSAYSAGQPSPLPEPALQFSDYALWKHRQIAGGSYAAHMRYWRETLSGDLPRLELPTDRPRPAEPTWRSGMETCTLPAQLVDGLKELSGREGATPYITLLAAFQILLYRYSGQDEIIMGGKTGTRARPEFEPLMGSFLNAIVFRSHIGAELSFREVLGRVKTTVLDALAHSEISFDDVVRELAPKRESGRHPLFQVLFSMQAPLDDFPDGWDITDMEIDSGASGFDLFVEFSERREGWAGRFVYSTDLFDRATIQRLQGNFQGLLQELVADPDQAISRVPMLAAQERAPKGIAPKEQYKAPGNSVERQLVDIWEALLAKRPIGVNQNFFDLGGHSLLVTKLLIQVERKFGQKLSMATILQAQTIEQLAVVLSGAGKRVNGVSSLQPFGSKPPFFCLGAGPLFRPLAHRLGSDRPFLSVNLEEEDINQLPSGYTMEDIAARFVAYIRAWQPEGPYYLGGWCMDGVLAYECARQLTSQGQKVDLLVLFDSPNPGFHQQQAKLVLSRTWFHISVMWKQKIQSVPSYIWDRLKGIAEDIVNIKSWVFYALESRTQYRRREGLQYFAIKNYRPEAYPGRVDLFRPAVRPKDPYPDCRIGWEDYVAGRLEAHEVPGDHETMFHEPNVGILASKMTDMIYRKPEVSGLARFEGDSPRRPAKFHEKLQAPGGAGCQPAADCQSASTYFE